MSYILEALKKAERERRKESVPDLQAHHTPSPPPGRPDSYPKRSVTLLISSLAILSIAALILFYLRREPVVDQTVTLPKVKVQEKQAEPAPPVKTEKPKQLPEQKQKVAQKKEIRQVQVMPKKVIVEPQPIIIQEETVVTPTPLPPPRQQQPNLPTYNDIAATMSDLPQLSLAGHTYSEDPEQRMIIINNRIVREGQRLGNGLRLEEITWDSLILNFKGTHFTMKATK